MNAAPGTAGRQAAVGISLQQEIQVESRPVTGVANSMQGMRTGGGRLVQDRSYYVGLFRTKVGEITEEINNSKSKIDNLNKEIAQGSQMERKMEMLLRDVREKEGTLADYNLALDKYRSGTRPEDIDHYKNQLTEQNSQLSRQVDEVFQRRAECQSATEQLQKQIDEERKKTADRMGSIVNELGPTKGRLYQSLLAENKKYEPALQSIWQEYEQVSYELQQAEHHLGMGSKIKVFQQLQKSIKAKRTEKQSLMDEANLVTMPPEEARASMLEKVKKDKAKLDQVTSMLESAEQEIMKHKKTLQLIDADLAERKGEGADTQKYEVLFERDREMTGFIDSFGTVKQTEMESQQKCQNTIVDLLKHISEGHQRDGQMPSRDAVASMRDDLSFKQRQLDSADSTKTRLEAELKKRSAELEKIENLDEKIERELFSLKQKMQAMEGEKQQFRQIASLRDQSESSKGELAGLKRSYIRRRDTVKVQVEQLQRAYERAQSALDDNEHASQMATLENKMRHYEQNIFSLREFIAAKEHDTHYTGVKDECKLLLDKLNDKVIAQTRSNPAGQQAEQQAAMGPRF